MSASSAANRSDNAALGSDLGQVEFPQQRLPLRYLGLPALPARSRPLCRHMARLVDVVDEIEASANSV